MDKTITKILLTITGIVIVFFIIKKIRDKMNPVKDISATLPRNGSWSKRSPEKVTDITIHHAASSNTATPQDFARHHIKPVSEGGKGWPGIGYFIVIDQKGNVFKTNTADAYSYHNGYNNGVSAGVCFVGNFTGGAMPTKEQVNAFEKVAMPFLLRTFPGIKFMNGHKDYKNATACPGNLSKLIPAWRDAFDLNDRTAILASSKGATAIPEINWQVENELFGDN